jgi:hypothetical protein
MIPPLNIEDTLTSVKTVLKDLTDVIGLFKKNTDSWFALRKSIKNKREIYKLEKILHALTTLNTEQLYVPRYLRRTADYLDKTFPRLELDPDEVKFARRDLLQCEVKFSERVEQIKERIVDLREFIDTNHPSLLERSPSIYDKIIDSLYQRQLFFGEITWSSDTPTQFTVNDAALLRSLADEYDEFISTLKEYRQLVASFLSKMDK